MRCLEQLSEAFASGGEDGAVKVWPLRAPDAVLRMWHVPLESDWIREVLLVSHVEVLVATNCGRIYRLLLKEEVESLLLYELEATFTCMALGHERLWIGCADGQGVLLEASKASQAVVRQVFEQCRVSACFAGATKGLFGDHRGGLRILDLSTMKLVCKQLEAKKGENQRLLCGLELKESWILGDEHGSLHLLDMESRKCHEGKVLDLVLLSDSDFLSSGVDGAVIRHRLDGQNWSQVAVHRCGLRHLSHLQISDPDVPGIPGLLIGAFQSADFVLWDSQACLELWRHRCGGAKRPNSLKADQESFTFAFSSSKALEIHSSGPSASQSLRPALHGREIHELCWLEPHLLATASEDTRLRLVRVKEHLEVEPTVCRFPGSVRALHSLSLQGTRLLVSGGAKGTLMAHVWQQGALRCVWSTSVSEDLEERIMAVSLMSLEASPTACWLAAASSSGHLRLWHMELKESELEVRLLEHRQVAQTTALCMEGFRNGASWAEKVRNFSHRTLFDPVSRPRIHLEPAGSLLDSTSISPLGLCGHLWRLCVRVPLRSVELSRASPAPGGGERHGFKVTRCGFPAANRWRRPPGGPLTLLPAAAAAEQPEDRGAPLRRACGALPQRHLELGPRSALEALGRAADRAAVRAFLQLPRA